MKTLILLFAVTSAFADSSFMVNMREANLKLQARKTELESPVAESRNFKVLRSIEDAPIDLNDDSLSKEEKLRAATVLYHLDVARDYFINTLQSKYVEELPQINIRIDMDRPFSEFYKFLSDSKTPQFNNAVTIPASTQIARRDVDPWNIEIWFRPAKKLEVDNVVFEISKQIDSVDVSKTIGSNTADEVVRDAVVQQALHESLKNMDYMGYASQLLMALGIIEVAPKIIMNIAAPIKTTTFLDTAMLPEVIYHEFTHVALADFISLRKSTPLNEGYANYFAAVINGHSKIASNNGTHSKNVSAFNGDQKMMYDSKLETVNAAHSNFVFSFLWNLRKRFEKDVKDGVLVCDKIIYAS